MILCTLYGLMSPLLPSATFTAICPLYGLMSPLRPYATSKNGPLSLIWPSTFYSLLSSLQPFPTLWPSKVPPPLSLTASVSSTALCPLYGPLTPSYSPMSPLWPSVPSMLSILPTLSVSSTPST